MGPLDLFLHLLGFAAPAFFLAAGMTLTARIFGLDRSRGRRWWAVAAMNFAAGVVVLAAGLAYFGNDGKMATYAALVLACATVQWLAGRSWTR